MTTTTNPLANVPLPTCAVKLYPGSDRDGQPVRCFRGTSWAVGRNDSDREIEVYIDGTQTVGHGIVRTIIVDDAGLTVDQARDLAAALTAAADEVDRLT